MPRVVLPLAVYLHTRLGRCSGISFIDSTSLSVCTNARIAQHRVFRVDARRGKTSVGWFYGFKLHLVVNDQGELLALCLTPGNVDDRRPVPRLARRLFGKLLGDRGARLPAPAEQLLVHFGLRLITTVRKNMRERLLAYTDKLLLRKRALIESITDQLKNICETLAHPPSQPVQFSRSPARRAYRLQSPAQEAITSPRSRTQPLGGGEMLIPN